MTAYDAVVFDNDGVLVEPPGEEAKSAAFRAAFAAVGVEDPPPEHVDTLVERVTADRLERVCRACGVDPGAFWTARERLDERAQFAAFRRGDREIYDDVAALADVPRPLGVASNNHHTTVAFVLEYFDLEPLFDTYHGREKSVDSLRRKKPDPHYVDRALADLGAESALYVGDKETDVVAARRAGVDAAFVRRDHNADLALGVDPTYEVSDLHAVAEIASDGR